jgi:hypothetical protein
MAPASHKESSKPHGLSSCLSIWLQSHGQIGVHTCQQSTELQPQLKDHPQPGDGVPQPQFVELQYVHPVPPPPDPGSGGGS